MILSLNFPFVTIAKVQKFNLFEYNLKQLLFHSTIKCTLTITWFLRVNNTSIITIISPIFIVVFLSNCYYKYKKQVFARNVVTKYSFLSIVPPAIKQ